MGAGEFKEVALERRGEVLWLTLNRPESANAMNPAMYSQLVAALSMVAVDGEVRAVVITGAGSRVFSAGADIKNPEGLPAEGLARQTSTWLMRALLAVVDFEKPTVAAVNGVASGAGCFLALLCDLVVAAPEASFVLFEIDVGRTTFPGLTLLSELASPKLAADLVLTGRRMGAAEAERRGLVAKVSSPGALLEDAQQLAALLASKPPTALALNKRWLRGPMREALVRASRASQEARGELLASGETQAATAAFLARQAAKRQNEQG